MPSRRTPGHDANPAAARPAAYRAAFVEPLAERVRAWLAEGKLDEDDLDRVLTAPARARVDGVCEASAATAAEDVESLVALLAGQLGGEAGLEELAGEIARGSFAERLLEPIQRAAQALVDGAAFAASQAADRLVADPDWRVESGRDGFALELRGVAGASPALKALLGGLLARIAGSSARSALDVRVEGQDGGALVVRGVAGAASVDDPSGATRLARAVLAA